MANTIAGCGCTPWPVMASHGNSLMRIKNLTAFFDLFWPQNSLKTLFTYHNHQINCSTRLIKKSFLIPNAALWYSLLETVQDFLIKLDIKPIMHLLEISIFLLNNDLVRLTKIMNNLVKDLKILSFKVIFQWLNLSEKKFLWRIFD